MSFNIRRINSNNSSRVRRSSTIGSKHVPILDDRLKYNPHPDEEWTYEGGEINYNGESINDLMNQNREDAETLVNISTGLTEYRTFVWNNGQKDNEKFNSRMDILLGKVTSRLGCIYEEKINGIACQYVDGTLWVNNINVSALIDLYQSKPDPRARAYLLSWKNKLSLIISNSSTNNASNVWWKAAKDLLFKLETALQCTPDSTHLLSAPSGK